MTAQLQF